MRARWPPKSLATSFKKGSAQALSLVVSHSIDSRLLAGSLAETQRAYPGLHLKLARGDAGEINESLQKGRADFAVAGPLGQAWERLDTWPLFEEKFELVVQRAAPLREGDGHRGGPARQAADPDQLQVRIGGRPGARAR